MFSWDLEWLYQKVGASQDRIYRLFAYLGRYGHQPVTALRGLTVREMMRLADEVSALVEYENQSSERSRDSD